jgi:hypothetical protein
LFQKKQLYNSEEFLLFINRLGKILFLMQ